MRARLFACLSGPPMCLSVYEQRWSVCVHCPTVSAENEKTPARRFGAGCQKNRKESAVGGKKNKKYPGSPEIYLFWLPASLKLPVGDFKMAPLPATEWALPCQNVFEWKTQTEKFPPFSLFPIVFLSLAPSFSPSSTSPPPSVHPSPHTERAFHPLQ